MNRYRVVWKHRDIGSLGEWARLNKGHGEWFTDKELVQAWVTEGNVRFPLIHHYLEEEKVSTSSNT